METREIVEGDFPACVDIFNEAWNELHRRHGFEEDLSDDEDDSWLTKPLAHFLQTDPGGGRIVVDEEGPLAFGSSLMREDLWYLSYLVRPPAWSKSRRGPRVVARAAATRCRGGTRVRG